MKNNQLNLIGVINTTHSLLIAAKIWKECADIRLIILIFNGCHGVYQNRIGSINSGDLCDVFWMQKGSVFRNRWSMAQVDEAGVAVCDVNDGSGQWQRVQNIRCVLNRSQANWRDASQHLSCDIRLYGQWNLAQVKVASIGFRVEKC